MSHRFAAPPADARISENRYARSRERHWTVHGVHVRLRLEKATASIRKHSA